MISNHFDACDESKCVSRGMSDLYGGFFTCYGGDDDSVFPKMCSDGFLPMVVEDEPPLLASHGNSNITVNHFTCCPPVTHKKMRALSPLAPTGATRRCSDPIISTDFNVEHNYTVKDICEGQGDRVFAYPRQGFSIQPYRGLGTLLNFTFLDSGAFVCCDSTPTNPVDSGSGNTTSASGVLPTIAHDFLDDLECVPYRNEHYEVARVQNEFNKIAVVSCDFSDGDFPFPRPIDGKDHVTLTGRYQCCRNGPTLPLYVQDSAFKVTVYPMVFGFSVMAVVSAILAAGLLAPLLIQSKRKHYNVYNFLLLHLGTIDFASAICRLRLLGDLLNQRFHPDWHLAHVLPSRYPGPFFNMVISVETVRTFANLWLNCLVCYQIWVLVTSSRRVRRIKPPSWTSMNLQIGAIYFASIVVGVIKFQLGSCRIYDDVYDDDGNVEISLSCYLHSDLIYFSLFAISSLYGLCTSILVWYRGYIPKPRGTSPRDNAARQLSIYFYRIVWVVLGTWTPYWIVILFAYKTGVMWPTIFSNMAAPVQSIITFCAVLTKSDVRQYVIDLVTLSYLNCSRAKKINGAINVEDAAEVLWEEEISSSLHALSNSSGVAGVDDTAKESPGLGTAEPRDSDDELVVSSPKDEACDEEAVVRRYESKQTRARPPLMVSASGNVVAAGTIQLAVDDHSIDP